MTSTKVIEVQGHRGARGLAPENTLVGFEIALDLGVTSIETDVHLSMEGVPVLFHDASVSAAVCDVPPGSGEPLVRSHSLQELRSYRVRGPAHPATPLAERFASQRGIDPCGIPTVAEFFDFVAAYAGPQGMEEGKSSAQQASARRLIFDLELKREPFRPETIGDGFDGYAPALLERNVIEAIQQAAMVARTRVRSFDHRSIVAISQLEPALATGLLIHNTAPANVAHLLAATRAQIYCPDYVFVDGEIVRQVHAVGARIIPFTVNREDEWERLLAWGVDGITTDYPNRLIECLARRG